MESNKVPPGNEQLLAKAEDQHDKPCKGCPFAIHVKPNWQDPDGKDNKGCPPLGGSPAEVYIGQALTPHRLPCHMRHDYTKLNERMDPHNVDCAGAAIFRSNCGVADRIPPQLLHLPSDEGHTVFADVYEFYAHHKGISVDDARKILDARTLDFLKKAVFCIAQVKMLSMPGSASIDFFKRK